MARPQRSTHAISDHEIFDAAVQLFVHLGPTNVTMTDVARRTGVSRATLYRRWPNVNSLMRASLGQEFERIARASLGDPASLSTLDGLVRVLVKLAAEIRSHPLVRTLIDLDPEFLGPYLFERRTVMVDDFAALATPLLQRGAAAGALRNDVDDWSELVGTIVLSISAFTFTARHYVDDPARLDELFSDLMTRLLEPLPRPTRKARSRRRGAPAAPSVDVPSTVGGYDAVDDDPVYDAAYELLLSLGPTKVTMSDVARASKVSRATLYRRWQNSTKIIDDVYNRTMLQHAATATSAWMAMDAERPQRERIVDGIVGFAELAQAEPLLWALIEKNPTWMLHYLVTQSSPSLLMMIDLLGNVLEVSNDDDSIRSDDRRGATLTIVLVAMSFVVSGHLVLDGEARDRRLRDLVDRLLRPGTSRG